VSAQPPDPGPPDTPDAPPPGTMRCPRCSATVAEEQDWCLECGAPARTRLAPTPNWQVPAIAVGAIVLIAGALLAFAFVKLTGDDGTTPSQGAPVIATQPAAPPAVAAPTVTAPTPTATATTPSQTQTTAPPTTVPGQPPAADGATQTTPRRERRP